MTKSGTRSANEMEKSFAALLKRSLEKQGLSQKQAAFAIWGEDEKSSQLSRYMNAKGGNPGAPTRAKISEGLGIPLEEIEACFEETPLPTRPVYTVEEHEQRLEKLETRLRADLEGKHGEEKKRLSLQIEIVNERLFHLHADYARTKQELEDARTLLNRYANQFEPEKLRAAYAALDHGERTLAEALFAEVQHSISQRIDDHSAEAAQIAMQRAKMAEEDFRWKDAAIHYAEAARLQPSFETIESAATFLWRSGENAEHSRYNARLLDLALVEYGLHHQNTAVALNNYENACGALGRHAEAEVFVRRALAINQSLGGVEQREVTISLNHLGLLLQSQDKLNEATAFHEQAYALCQKLFEEDDEDFLATLNNLGLVRKRQGHLDEAESFYRRSLEISEKIYRKTNPHIAVRVNNFSGVLYEKGRLEEAAALSERALYITEQNFGSDNVDLIHMLTNLATVYCKLDRFEQAEPHFLRAIQICEIREEDTGRQARDCFLNYACMLRDTERFAEAEHAFVRVIQIDKGAGNIASPGHAIALNHYAKCW